MTAAGAEGLLKFRPRLVAILGATAYRTAFGSTRTILGHSQRT